MRRCHEPRWGSVWVPSAKPQGSDGSQPAVNLRLRVGTTLPPGAAVRPRHHKRERRGFGAVCHKVTRRKPAPLLQATAIEHEAPLWVRVLGRLEVNHGGATQDDKPAGKIYTHVQGNGEMAGW